MTTRNIVTSLSYAAAATVTAIALIAPATPQDQKQTIRTGLQGARMQLVDHFDDVQARSGSAGAVLARLDADLGQLSEMDASAPPDDWDAAVLRARLDEGLVTQLVSGAYLNLRDVRGAESVVFAASADGTVQPLAVYVPQPYDARKSVPLIVMLHGQDQTESQLLATPWLRTLADQTHVILAAPWARGDRGFDNLTSSDVYDALHALEAALNVDRRRVFLTGFSTGGFGVFLVGPLHPERWTALLSVAGSLTNDDMQSVARGMRGKQVFLVAGGDDARVKAEYVRAAAAWLTSNGVESRYYEQPRGVHSLQSLQPAVEHAWRDMLSGVRFVAPEFDIPTPRPTASQRD